MKVLITGGAGFLGSHLVEHYLNKGHEVYCIDHLGSGSKSNMELFETNGNYHFFEHDVSKPLPSSIPRVDLILHFASRASPPDYQAYPFDTISANTIGTENLLQRALKDGSRLVYASTSEIYGNPPREVEINDKTYKLIPSPECFLGLVNSFGVRACYDESKRAGEAWVFEYIRKGVDARVVRIFNTFGPRMRVDDGRVVTNFIKQAIHNKPLTIYGAGGQMRSYCYVDDLINGIVRVASFEFDDEFEKKLSRYVMGNQLKYPGDYLFDFHNELKLKRVFNVGNNIEHKSVIELADLIVSLTGSKSELEFHELPEDDPVDRVPDTTKIRYLLGYKPKTTLREGLERTINHFKEKMK